MRHTLLPAGKGQSDYEIRGIVSKGFQLESKGHRIFWENIGDPVQKGMKIPAWMKEVIHHEIDNDSSYAYCESKGVPSTRQFLADKTNSYGGTQITADDITFFNGLGDAIARVYGLLDPTARILMPSPTYPAHSGVELSRTGKPLIQYRLDPDNNWMPDIGEIRSQVESNPDITAILIINPDNPTGTLFPEYVLQEICDIAEEFGLFIICDEIYENLIYDGKMTRLCEVAGNKVPAIVMKGISKEFPWPGSRCGWVEYYNRSADAEFDAFCRRVDHVKMTEVCSTTLPQLVIPAMMTHPEYPQWLKTVNTQLKNRMDKVRLVLGDIPGFTITSGGGAFYVTVQTNCCDMNYSVPYQRLTDEQLDTIRSWMKPQSAADYKLVYYLLCVYGVCVVPLSGFATKECGFRFTLLEQDESTFNEILNRLQLALSQWVSVPKPVPAHAESSELSMAVTT
ncbi:MAG: pyridoxal phosphate-dependent aminotransferase [Balneolales bacterium]|nr:pyridoxal phosphate-dependent aminotransferase [Balneolales bacterium]